MGDFDGDGYADLVETYSCAYGQTCPYLQRPQLWRNWGAGDWVKTDEGQLTQDVSEGIDLAVADFDLDGVLDIFVANRVAVGHRNAVPLPTNGFYKYTRPGTTAIGASTGSPSWSKLTGQDSTSGQLLATRSASFFTAAADLNGDGASATLDLK